MNKIKKSMLFVGTAATIIAPITTVVACGGDEGDNTEHFNLLPTYTGQEDQLIALGIHADYYPLQLNEKSPYSYLTNPGQFMKLQDNDFKAKFAKRVAGLMPKRQGTGWWNQDALDSDERGSDPAYWQSKSAGVLLYEHYLLDDDRKIVKKSQSPVHAEGAAVQTNFRSSRDPYTRINKGVFFGWDLTDDEIKSIIDNTTPKSVTIKGLKAVDVTVSVTVADANVIKAMRAKRKELQTQSSDDAKKGESDWFYNDWYFVDSYHRMFLDNNDFQGIYENENDHSKVASLKAHAGAFAEWLLDSTTDSPFTTHADRTTSSTADADIKSLFDASTFREVEVANGVGPSSNSNPHHPIYEQQDGEIGAAPMFEGAMRDNQLYLFNVAWQLDNLVTYGTPYGKQHFDEMAAAEALAKSKGKQIVVSKTFDGIATTTEQAIKIQRYVQSSLTARQVVESKKAFENSLAITAELKERMSNMKKYFTAIKSVDETLGLLTIAPGHGVSTIQSMSKYSFIYKELGFKQPLPANLHDLAKGSAEFAKGWNPTHTKNKYLKDGKVIDAAPTIVKAAVGKAKESGAATLFNMDDNGWYWTIGETGKLQTEQLKQFAGQFDYGFIAARDKNYDAEIGGNDINKNAVKALFKDGNDFAKSKVNYDEWNEGLKTPFVLHMILDEIMERVEAKHKADMKGHDAERNLAKSWGNYFSKTYIEGIK